ncbi:MAG: PaaI family thioesterase [Oligoflexia bacterium]|jgi:uncharacterized protein (TIGR00369 family)|nr:PaaI family thioesterase [Bacteroidota bacterium]MCP4914896.1 PaaI family thioesterase [Oligoflexia bacterium]
MKNEKHFKALESMYLAAPTNEYYKPVINISEGESEITIELKESMYHSANAVHGSVYFKLLDDSAFFAANSFEMDFFVLTSSFTTYLTRPMTSGQLKAVGRVVSKTKNQWIAESVAYNGEKEVARGSGVFVRGKTKLLDARGYSI